MDRIGPFEKITEYQGQALPDGVFVALRSVPYTADNHHVWTFEGPSRWIQNLARFYLCIGYPASNHGQKIDADERYRRMKFNQAVAEIARVSIQSALNLLPHRLGLPLTTRIEGERAVFNTFDETTPIVLQEIVRGGSWVSQLAQKEILPPWVGTIGRITASAQRTVTNGKATVAFSIKGACPLGGSTLLTIEQALATGTTATDVTPEVLRRCRSIPEKMIFIAYNAAVDGILKVKECFPNATVLVVILHGGINQHGYLIHPGCGDVGRMDAGVPDEL